MKNPFVVAVRYARNKYHMTSFNKRLIREAPRKIINHAEFLEAYRNPSSHELIVRFADGYKLACMNSDLSAVGETGVLEDYRPDDRFDIGPGDTVFDVGAHIGSFSVYAANKGARVFAFEPLPENFKRLLANIALNGMEGKITPVNEGIYYTATELPFFFDEHNTGGNSIISGQGLRQATNIRVNTIDHFLERFGLDKIDLMKIDIEGAEYEIFSSLPPEVFSRIQKIVGEYHLSFNHRNNFFDIKKSLSPHFQTVSYFSPYYFFAVK